jgi:hypothetical protein
MIETSIEYRNLNDIRARMSRWPFNAPELADVNTKFLEYAEDRRKLIGAFDGFVKWFRLVIRMQATWMTKEHQEMLVPEYIRALVLDREVIEELIALHYESMCREYPYPADIFR